MSQYSSLIKIYYKTMVQFYVLVTIHFKIHVYSTHHVALNHFNKKMNALFILSIFIPLLIRNLLNIIPTITKTIKDFL